MPLFVPIMAVRSEPGGAMPAVLAALADVFWPEELLRPGVRTQRYTELPSVGRAGMSVWKVTLVHGNMKRESVIGLSGATYSMTAAN